jgi:Anti-sigma-D factor RsdA to sigma factor binding region
VRDDTYGPGRNPFEHRRPRHSSNGHRPAHMQTRPVPLDEIGEPVDLVAVQADDELINALAAGMTVSSHGRGGYGADDRVAAILAAWKADVDVDPIPELIDTDTAVATVRAARRPGRRARHLAPVAAAAAFVVLAIGAVSVGSYNAQPDDALWGVSKVLYSQRAESVEAAVRVEARITKAKEALVAGQPVTAAQELQEARADLSVVRPEEGRNELTQVQEFLVAKAAETPNGTPTDPGTPLSTQPSRPVPPGAAIQRPGRSSSTEPPQPSGTQVPPSSASVLQGVPASPASGSSTPATGESSSRDPRHQRGGPGPGGPGDGSSPDPRRQLSPASPGGPSGGPSSPPGATTAPQAPPPSRDPGAPNSPETTTRPQTPPATAEGEPQGSSSTRPGQSTGGSTSSTQSMGGTPSPDRGPDGRHTASRGDGGLTGTTAAGSDSEPPTSTVS